MLRFVPHYQPALWGGRNLERLFGRQLPKGAIGESWELVELPERHSQGQGSAHNKDLGTLWREGALGGSAQGPFPFLLKWIDAADILSVQVHPDEEACARMGRGRPKTEAWYVVHAEPGSALTIGHHAGLTPEALRRAAQDESLDKWLYQVRATRGDMFLLRAGQIHAIGRGYVLLEVQQPSDTTYRLYDFGRVGTDGKKRELHLDDACACVSYDRSGPGIAKHDAIGGPCFSLKSLKPHARVEADGLRVFVADLGPATLKTAREEVHLHHGDVIVAEPGDGAVEVVSGSAVLVGEA